MKLSFGEERDLASIIEKLKSQFTRCSAEFEYLPTESRFRWCGTPNLPKECGVYCIFSHDDSRIQKIGKAERKRGLRGRFGDYTVKKTSAKLAKDSTDQLWKRAMVEGVLSGMRLGVYYYVTVPTKVQSPISFDDGAGEELDCHWARSLEKYLSGLVRNECEERNLAGTHLLLSGIAD